MFNTHLRVENPGCTFTKTLFAWTSPAFNQGRGARYSARSLGRLIALPPLFLAAICSNACIDFFPIAREFSGCRRVARDSIHSLFRPLCAADKREGSPVV